MTISEKEDGSLTPKGLKRWKTMFQNVKSIEEEIKRQMLVLNKFVIGDKVQLKFVWVLAKLCTKKDSPEEFLRQYNFFYRWIWQFNREFGEDGEAMSVFDNRDSLALEDDNIPLPCGWQWMLQIYCNDKWWDWVYVKQSTRADGNLGLFTARDFPKGSIIGFYVSPSIYSGKVAGGAKPTDEEILTTGLKPSNHFIFVRDRNGVWQVMDTGKNQDVNNCARGRLYMGMHYINTACHSFEEGSNEYSKGTNNLNCSIIVDGGVQLTKKLGKNKELLAGYESYERNDERKEWSGRSDSDSDGGDGGGGDDNSDCRKKKRAKKCKEEGKV
jgi:hypothetical protein